MSYVITSLVSLVVGGVLVWIYHSKLTAAAQKETAAAKAELASLKASVAAKL